MAWWNPFEKKAVQPSGLVNPQDWMFANFGATVPGAVGVSASNALKVPAVQSAIKLLSEAAATLDVKVKVRKGKATQDAPEHPAWNLLRGDANAWTSGFELIRSLVIESLTNDQGGFAWVNRPGDKPLEIIKYGAGQIGVTYAPDGSGEPTYTKDGKTLNPADIVHVRGAFAHCPLTLARTAIGMAALLEEYGANLFANGAKPGGLLKTDKKLGDAGVKDMLAGWRLAQEGAAKSGKTAILWDGADFVPLTMTSTDTQYLENRKFQIIEVARAFRVPPGMLYDLERQTWNNGEQMGKEFLSYSLEPHLRALEGALSRALLTPEERKTHSIVFDRDDLTRADLSERATAYSSLVAARIYNPNEIREWEGDAPYTGGDEFINPAIQQVPANDNTPRREAA